MDDMWGERGKKWGFISKIKNAVHILGLTGRER